MRLARLGLDEYLPSDTPPEVVAQRLSELADARRAVESEALRANGTALIGRSRAMRQVAEVARLIAARRSTVLITGPTGTGKELVARLIHNLSPRAGRPMVTVNCGAIPEHLLEAEFFGHVKGAFTGAVATRIGRFEQAQGSTLFLDEIGDMPIELQAKVLRAVQEREFQRVGSSETVQVDVRVIAATNQDLTEKVRKGEFREDLYYRLNVVPVAMPPLADRLEDVPSLVHHFLEKVARREALPRKHVAPEALDRLTQYHWPGNVRQLENVVEKAAVLSGERQELYTSDFALPAPEPRLDSRVPTAVDLPPGGLDLNEYLSQVELHLLRQALERAGGNKNRAAQFLRLKRTTLSAKLKSCRAAKL
jgi:transcriptional regulator with GAF, ATPase, and Fis domain